MAEMMAMAPQGSKLERFLSGHKWSSKYARLSLPVLVRWAEEERATVAGEICERTYKDLAVAVGQPRHAHPIHEALGVLGFALRELKTSKPKVFDTEIPPIQLLVWSKGMGRPGDDAFWFLGITKEQLKAIPEQALRLLAKQTRAQILNYPHWRLVLDALNLKPLTINLPEAKSVISNQGFAGGAGGESTEHQRLKHFLGSHYSLLGISGLFKPLFEEQLLSGDRADLLLVEVNGKRRICVEAKSRISNQADLIRGLFQCVKYRAVLDAHEVYNGARAADWSSNLIDVILVTECQLPNDFAELATLLGVKSAVVVVPVSYSILPAELVNEMKLIGSEARPE